MSPKLLRCAVLHICLRFLFFASAGTKGEVGGGVVRKKHHGIDEIILFHLVYFGSFFHQSLAHSYSLRGGSFMRGRRYMFW